jgi:S-adenosylmethionine synthetase
MKKRYLVTSESVGPGHPDKICDQISDSILDVLLKRDPNSRVAVNASVKNNKVFVFGEVTTKAKIDYKKVALETLRSIGLTEDFDFNIEISTQSPDISQGVDTGGAGDQGMVIGYATNETDTYMPLPIYFSHLIMRKINEARLGGSLKWAGPDMKCQVTVDYNLVENEWESGRCPVKAIVVSVQHSEDYNEATFKKSIKGIINSVLSSENYSYYPKFDLYVNNTGSFIVGGSYGDSGLTGRKIIVDTYGGIVPHGGGAFSGKDYTKVDRSGAYAARWIAKNIVASKLAKRCEIQISYAIGRAEPISLYVNTYGTGDDNYISDMVSKLFPLTPKWIRDKLKLNKPIYAATAVYGHFGRDDLDLPWEKLDLLEDISSFSKKGEKG